MKALEWKGGRMETPSFPSSNLPAFSAKDARYNHGSVEVLDVQNLCKSFGKKPFLTELTFQVGDGECLVLLGRNGAGKTLLFNILATLVEPTSGTVSIAGVDAFANLKQVRPSIGYIPMTFDGYPELSVVDYLNFFAAAYKLEKRERASAMDAVLELMDIQHLRDVKMGDLSTGERHRLLFAKTFLHEPQLWLLDEPLTPLDPSGQVEMVELLGELQAMGKTLIIATNRLEDVFKVCNTDVQRENFIGILNSGRFAVFKKFSELQREVTEADSPSPNWLNELFLEVTKT
ncbi:ABC transporter ATP-binding protein [Candidatus Poribacteria bacterium]|nr:ABC transporter ATP-binding protein [Candidatus Poribacteria bacterium]MYH79462.1 ABC transporter ATP-binding protein [Candidatus Poribacteria bacterium]MYK96727.1 ABC transporter ATP-binding protein [Candidatus Poribacteria bacterium]